MGTAQENFCLRWNDFESNLSSAFSELRNDEDLHDVVLATDEDQVGAHKVVLSACSPHLKEVIRKHAKISGSRNNMLIYLRGVRHMDLLSVLEFMYCGAVNVAQEDLNSFLSVAEDLKVKGLTQNIAKDGPAASSSASKNGMGIGKRSKPAGSPAIPTPTKRFRPSTSGGDGATAAAASSSTTTSSDIKLKTEEIAKEDIDDLEDPVEEAEGFDDAGDYFGDGADQGADALGFEGDDSGAGPSDAGKGSGRKKRSSAHHLHFKDTGGGFACQLCGVIVTRLGDGSRHLRQMHIEKEFVFVCPYCDNVLKTRGSLKGHLLTSHRMSTRNFNFDENKVHKSRVEALKTSRKKLKKEGESENEIESD